MQKKILFVDAAIASLLFKKSDTVYLSILIISMTDLACKKLCFDLFFIHESSYDTYCIYESCHSEPLFMNVTIKNMCDFFRNFCHIKSFLLEYYQDKYFFKNPVMADVLFLIVPVNFFCKDCHGKFFSLMNTTTEYLIMITTMANLLFIIVAIEMLCS